jgi:ATP-dependent Lon protease
VTDGAGVRPNLGRALGAIPIFPLPQVVLFPGALLPLHVFEPRYRTMLSDCLATHKAIAVAQLLAGEDENGQPRMTRICGGGIIVEHEALADGRSNILVLGQERLHLDEIALEELPRYPYRRARAHVIEPDDHAIPDADRSALVAAAAMFATEVKRHDPDFSFRVPPTTDAAAIADLCAFQLVIDAAARQAILEEIDPRARVEMVMNQLALQHGAMMRDEPGKVLN